MANILLLFTCILSGFLLRRTSHFGAASATVLNKLIIYFFIPVITLHHIPRIEFQFNLMWLSITPFLMYGLSFLFIKILSSFRQLDHGTEGALIMTCGIGSTSFVGFPIFEMLYGEEGLAYGIVLSLAGTILVFNTLGIATGLYYARQAENLTGFLRRLLLFPPFVTFLIAFVLNVSGGHFPGPLEVLLSQLAAPFSIIALLAIGMQIDMKVDRTLITNLLTGLFFKLILAPALLYLFMWQVLGVQDTIAKVCILGAAIGSMNAVSIVAAELGLDPKLAVAMPALGIPLSVVSLLLIDFLLF